MRSSDFRFVYGLLHREASFGFLENCKVGEDLGPGPQSSDDFPGFLQSTRIVDLFALLDCPQDVLPGRHVQGPRGGGGQ